MGGFEIFPQPCPQIAVYKIVGPTAISVGKNKYFSKLSDCGHGLWPRPIDLALTIFLQK